MPKKSFLIKVLIGAFIIGDFVWLMIFLIHQSPIQLLSPQGLIAEKEKGLIVFVSLLGLSIIIPVVLIIFLTAFRYRETNTKAKHAPDVTHHKLVQAIWWIFPSLMVLLVSLSIWKTSHELDPMKPIVPNSKSLVIQVVALRWKWLFIYPEENVASVNDVVFPEKTPLEFQLTAEAPMNSFWIPRLGGQLYAMEGMVNKTHLIANTTGDFTGQSAEISGKGFADMRFTAHSVTKEEYESWLEKVKDSSETLDLATYTKLAQPSEQIKPTFFSPVEKDLYNEIVMKYMTPISPTKQQDSQMSRMNMKQ